MWYGKTDGVCYVVIVMAMAASDESRVSLRWVNFSNHAVTLLQQSLIDEDTCDVTLVAAADYTHCTASVKAHKLVIAASSPLFHTILKVIYYTIHFTSIQYKH